LKIFKGFILINETFKYLSYIFKVVKDFKNIIPEYFYVYYTIRPMNLTLILFLIGILGFVFNRKNIILILISIEIMLLSITFLILISSINLDDIIAQVYAIYIIIIAGAESAIGLAILVAFYRLRGSIVIEYK
jgi:NADH-ubiquinone oxidoreductase chain 4L